MNIINNKDIAIIKQQLAEELCKNIVTFEALLLEQEQKVVKWQFANDEFYSPIPFYHELNKLKQGRLLKDIEFADRFNRANVFSFGFSEDTRLLLMQKSNGKDLGVNSKVYEYKKNGIVQYFTICTYYSSRLPNKLISLGILTPITNDIQIDLVLSSNKQNWAVTVYKYERGLVTKSYRYSEGWNGQAEYDYIYNQGLLERIKIGTIDWWRSPKL